MNKNYLLKSIVTAICFLLFITTETFALNYTITFTGSGASTNVDDVIVQNLTKGTTVTVPPGNVLNLSNQLSSVEPLSAADEIIQVYLNSVERKSKVSFFAKQTGVTQINVFNIDGRKIAGMTAILQMGVNSFQLSLPKGTFAIQVSGNGYAYSAKVMNQTGIQCKPGISYVGDEKPASPNQQKSKSFTLGMTTMAYDSGDRLLYKAVSGTYSTIVTDIPTTSKTTNFSFAACTDADGNNYTTVTIGSQIWMVENLKTTKYCNGDLIGTTNPLTKDITYETTPKYQWAYNGDETNVAIYGRLYTWYAVSDSRNIAPIGWHVPTDEEWNILQEYLGINGYSYNTQTPIYIAKSLACNYLWGISGSDGDVGKDLSQNNSTGYSAVPGGSRAYNGTFGMINSMGYWWSSTEYFTYQSTVRAYNRQLSSYYPFLGKSDSSKNYGYSVRCIKD